jgi:thiol-disulfide isomerase/thioredoxin
VDTPRTPPTYRPVNIARPSAALAVLLCLGCVGKIDGYDPRPGNADAGPEIGDPDAGNLPGTPDAAFVPGDPDAYVPPPVPDAAPPPYPSGPYGYNVGSTVSNLSWTGYIDSATDTDKDPFNEPSRTVTMEEFFVGTDPGARVIIVNASAGWCGSCQEEMPKLESLFSDYESRGLRIISALFENTSGSAADTAFARSWGESFSLSFATVADPSDTLAPYYTENAVPMNMIVDASTMKIVEVFHGFDEYYVRQIVDNYVD